ncbi:MAG: insulinase family protein [Ruminococcus sp.]|nr:insulinase family protein [Ruminococcus sp.]MCM1381283.1 insulinase family protein [Muribaculaceae bacterium]MCM1479631.1 insulinase family protein [Muribaculaceae bacterium]
MPINYSREKIADGIHYSTIINKRLKTNYIIVHLLTVLSEETASLNAVIPAVLASTNAKLTTITDFSMKLSSLYGASVRGYAAKQSDNQNLVISAGCINDRYCLEGERITEELAEVVADCLTDPHLEGNAFFESDFALKKRELLDEIDAEINSKRSYAFKRANLNVFKGEPAAVSARGDKEQAEKITAAEAYGQYKKLLKTARMEIFFIGAEPNESCKRILSDRLSKIDRDYAGDSKAEKSPLKAEVCRVTEPLDIAQSKMFMAFKTDCDNLDAMGVFDAVYGTTPNSKLFMNVREKLSLCYYCSLMYNEAKGVVYVDSGTEHANTGKAEAEILNQLEAMKKGDFTDEELENARRSILNHLRGVNDSFNSLANWYFARICDGNIYTPEEQIERINKITREDVIAAANTLKLDTVYVLTGKEAV